MATHDGERALDRLLRRSSSQLPAASWATTGDLARASMEALVSSVEGDTLGLASRGRLRLWGPGVPDHRADLEVFGTVATSWQRALHSVGASLEGVTSARGRLSQTLLNRTAVVVAAEPGVGSVTLRIEAKADPLPEVAPDGATVLQSPSWSDPVMPSPRPLVDQAADELLEVLAVVGSVTPDNFDSAEGRLRARGPRVASSLKMLAGALSAADVHLDAEWEEPGAPTHRTTVTAEQARWISQFIEGRDLDTEIEVVEGEAITVSSRERWLLHVDGEDERVRIGDLPADVAASVSPGDTVRLEVDTKSRLLPDGTLKTSRVARRVLEVRKPGAHASNT